MSNTTTWKREYNALSTTLAQHYSYRATFSIYSALTPQEKVRRYNKGKAFLQSVDDLYHITIDTDFMKEFFNESISENDEAMFYVRLLQNATEMIKNPSNPEHYNRLNLQWLQYKSDSMNERRSSACVNYFNIIYAAFGTLGGFGGIALSILGLDLALEAMIYPSVALLLPMAPCFVLICSAALLLISTGVMIVESLRLEMNLRYASNKQVKEIDDFIESFDPKKGNLMSAAGAPPIIPTAFPNAPVMG